MTSQSEGQGLFKRVNNVCAQFLNYTTRYLGSIENDELILAAHKRYEPVMEFAPRSGAARDFNRLADSSCALADINQLSGGMQFFVERLVRFRA